MKKLDGIGAGRRGWRPRIGCAHVRLAVLGVAMFGCESGDSAVVDPPSANRGPEGVESIDPVALEVGQVVTLEVARHFRDPDGDPLTFGASSSDAAVADAAVAGTELTIIGVAEGRASVRVTASDPAGLSASLPVAVTVTRANQAPAVTDSIAPVELRAGTTRSLDLAGHFRDPDGDSLTFRASSSDAAVAVAAVAGSELTITGVAEGRASVEVTASDPGGLSASLPVAVAVSPANRAPAVADSIAPVELRAGATQSLDLAGHFRDPDGDSLTFRASSSDAAVAVAAVAGSELTITGVAEGSASVEVTASDPGGLSASLPVAVAVSPPNQAPAVADSIAPVGLRPGATRSLDLAGHFSDPDGDSLTFRARSSDLGVVVAAVAGSELTITGVAEGSASVEVTASDPGGLSASLPVAVAVRAGNRAPVVADSIAPVELRVGATRLLDLAGHFSDPDGDSLTFRASSTDAAVAVAAVTGTELTITGVAEGVTTAIVMADDGEADVALVFNVSVTDAAPFSFFDGFDGPFLGGDWETLQVDALIQDGVLDLSTTLPGFGGAMVTDWGSFADTTAFVPFEARARVSFDTERVGIELWLGSATRIVALVLGRARVPEPSNYQVSVWTDIFQPVGEPVEGSAGFSAALPRASEEFVEVKFTRTHGRLLATLDGEQILDLDVSDWAATRITSFAILVSGEVGGLDVDHTVSVDFVSLREMRQ